MSSKSSGVRLNGLKRKLYDALHRASFVAGTLVALFLLRAGPVAAQVCFPARPEPECRTFAVTEFGLAVPMPDTPESFYATWQAGLMRRIQERAALGVVGYVGVGEEARGGVRARARLWLSPRLTLDTGVGLLLFDDRFGAEIPGFSGEIALGYREIVALSLQVESVENPFSAERVIWYPGIKAQGYAGTGLGIAGAVVAAIVVIGRAIE
jgi:hypothetical protein